MRGSQGLFWGIFLIGIGILMIIKYQFKLNISMPRIVFGVLLLALGISMLLGGPGLKTQSNIIFSEGNVQAVKPEKEYNVIFGNLVIDLATISRDELVDWQELFLVPYPGILSFLLYRTSLLNEGDKQDKKYTAYEKIAYFSHSFYHCFYFGLFAYAFCAYNFFTSC
jgi:hypothetical protein